MPRAHAGFRQSPPWTFAAGMPWRWHSPSAASVERAAAQAKRASSNSASRDLASSRRQVSRSSRAVVASSWRCVSTSDDHPVRREVLRRQRRMMVAVAHGAVRCREIRPGLARHPWTSCIEILICWPSPVAFVMQGGDDGHRTGGRAHVVGGRDADLCRGKIGRIQTPAMPWITVSNARMSRYGPSWPKPESEQ